MSGMQALIAYAVVAFAAGWVAWSMFVPSKFKKRLRGRVRLKR